MRTRELNDGLLALGVVAALASAPAFAHHSFAMFQPKQVDVIRGTLLTFTYLNPHSWVSVIGVVGKAGPMERWDIEMTSPGSLQRMGIQPNTIKPGDRVTVAFHPLVDGRHGGSMVFIVTPDGVVHGANPSEVGVDPASLKPQS